MEDKKTHRLNVEITQRQHDALWKHIPWGIRSAIIGNMIDCLIEALEVDANVTVMGMLKGTLEIRLKEE